MIEAYLYFYNQLASFFLVSETEQPLAGYHTLASRLDVCFQALKSTLQVVVIDLDKDDDAQVIFETLNARGEPLLPADLLRNYIFLRAARQGEPQEELYGQYWSKFDDPFWRHEIRQGRLLRPRSDLFMQHFLASRQTVDIPIKHLFTEYKYWIEKKQPFPTVREELITLARQGDDFHRIIEPRRDDVVYPLATFLECFDISTVHPLLLFLLDGKPSDLDLNSISATIESYLLRRAVCGFTTKNYNRIFLGLTRFLQQTASTSKNIYEYLSGLSGESSEWPTDETFGKEWQNRHAYQTLDNKKIVYILRRLSDSYLSNKTELISIDNPLTVEHILPQDWLENWPLPDGSKGLNYQELWESESGNSKAEATRNRNSVLQTLGNLAILTQPLNSAISNSAWAIKKSKLLMSSLLPINQQLNSYKTWDEEAIERRSKELFERAASIWLAPSLINP